MCDDLKAIASLGNRCCGCGACAAVCPKGCISMVPDVWGFPRSRVDSSACVGCGRCASACPALSDSRPDEVSSVSWAKSGDGDELKRSSSGGVFGLLAADVLASGGVVAGAAWDPGFRSVSHRLIDDISCLDAVMRSKYVQSSVPADVYRGVRDALWRGRRALFSGTACQVAGLRGYLGPLAGSDLLLAVDVVCHGVPAPALWSRWIAYREAAVGAPLRGVNMRSKATGWPSYSILYKFGAGEDGRPTTESSVFRDDWYMRAFLANACLRPCCFSCPAKRSCGSDVTIGDFWGVQSAHPEVDSGSGVSAVICNTRKGEAALAAVSGALDSGPSTYDSVLAGNPSLAAPASPYVRYDEFMASVAAGVPIEELIARWGFEPPLGRSLVSRLKGAVGRLLCLIASALRGLSAAII